MSEIVIRVPERQPRESSHTNIEIVRQFGGKEFSIDTGRFAARSDRFARDIHELERVIIESDVSEDAVEQFVEGCWGRNMKVHADNVFDLLELAEEWEVEVMKQPLYKYIDKYSSPCLIPGIIYARKRGEDTSALEARLQRGFLSQMSNDRIFECGFEVLFRVFSLNNHEINRGNFHWVFNFLIRALEYFGGTASALFTGGVDLTPDEMSRLQSSPNFIWEFIAGTGKPSVTQETARPSSCDSRQIAQWQTVNVLGIAILCLVSLLVGYSMASSNEKGTPVGGLDLDQTTTRALLARVAALESNLAKQKSGRETQYKALSESLNHARSEWQRDIWKVKQEISSLMATVIPVEDRVDEWANVTATLMYRVEQVESTLEEVESNRVTDSMSLGNNVNVSAIGGDAAHVAASAFVSGDCSERH